MTLMACKTNIRHRASAMRRLRLIVLTLDRTCACFDLRLELRGADYPSAIFESLRDPQARGLSFVEIACVDDWRAGQSRVECPFVPLMVAITQHNLWRVQDARYPARGYSRLHAHSPDSPSAAPRTALGLLIPESRFENPNFGCGSRHAEPGPRCGSWRL